MTNKQKKEYVHKEFELRSSRCLLVSVFTVTELGNSIYITLWSLPSAHAVILGVLYISIKAAMALCMNIPK